MVIAKLFGSNDDETHKISFFRDRHLPITRWLHAGSRPKTNRYFGGGLGALAGSQIGNGSGKLAAVAIGTLAGAALGNEVGRSLDRADRLEMSAAARAAQHAPIGSSIRWENPSSGNYGSITPRREGRHRRSGAVCREFSNSLTIDGQTDDFVGVACRARDGG